MIGVNSSSQTDAETAEIGWKGLRHDRDGVDDGPIRVALKKLLVRGTSMTRFLPFVFTASAGLLGSTIAQGSDSMQE